MGKKSVLFIAPRFHTNQFFLTKNLVEEGIDVNFVAIYIGSSENHQFIKPILSCPSKFLKFLYKNYSAGNARGRAWLRKYHLGSFRQCFHIYQTVKPNVVILRNLRSLHSLQHLFFAKCYGKEIILYTQNNYREKLSFSRIIFYKILKTLKIHHITPVFGNENFPVVPNTNYLPFVIDPLVSIDDIRARLNHPKIRVVSVGKMTPRKRIIELIECLIRIGFFNDPSNNLSIISECSSVEHTRYLEKVQIYLEKYHENIHLHLNIDHKEVIDIMRTADLFVLPSNDEPAAFSLLEAMASGLAVISSDANGTKDYITENVNGFIYRYTADLRNLDNLLLQIINKAKLNEFGINSLKLINKNHTIHPYLKLINQKKC